VLSVVVITKNQAWNIARLLQSVEHEISNLPQAEIVVADSASTDATTEIACEFPRVQIARLRPDQRLTPAAGRYVGFHHTRGDIILHMDGDTQLVPGWLRTAMQVLQDQGDVAGVSGICIEVPKETTPLLATGDSEHGSRVVPYLTGRVSLYRRSVLEEVGTFQPYLLAEEEPELGLRIRHAGYRLVELQQPAIFHRSDEEPETFSILICRWQRSFLFAQGQILRHLYGTPLFWRYAYERGYAVVPALAILAGCIAAATSVASRNYWWLSAYILAVTTVLALDSLRKRSVKKTAVSVFFRLLSIAGAIKGATIATLPASTYRTDSELWRSTKQGIAI
jgi:glycosyltransferase involved in cell wall biosynthesis